MSSKRFAAIWGQKSLALTMEVRAYREKTGLRHNPKRSAQELWAYLKEASAVAPA